MKRGELEKIKKSLEEQGFEYHITDTNKDQVVMIIQSKDHWDGVEFFDQSGQVIKIQKKDKNGFYWGNGNFTGRDFHGAKPSTEAAYIEQLKKESFERFGEIKEGDRFDRSSIGISQEYQNIITITKNSLEFDYDKDSDNLSYRGYKIYRQGKWATKIERVEVEKSICYHDLITDDYRFTFKISKKINNQFDAHTFLTEQLTKYLNNERPD